MISLKDFILEDIDANLAQFDKINNESLFNDIVTAPSTSKYEKSFSALKDALDSVVSPKLFNFGQNPRFKKGKSYIIMVDPNEDNARKSHAYKAPDNFLDGTGVSHGWMIVSDGTKLHRNSIKISANSDDSYQKGRGNINIFRAIANYEDLQYQLQHVRNHYLNATLYVYELPNEVGAQIYTMLLDLICAQTGDKPYTFNNYNRTIKMD